MTTTLRLTTVLEFDRLLSPEEIEILRRVAEGIDEAVWDHWDWEEDLKKTVRELVSLLLKDRRCVENAVEETFDEYFQRGFENGTPPKVFSEVDKHVTKIMNQYFGPELKRKATRKKK